MIKQIGKIVKESGRANKWIALSCGTSIPTVDNLRYGITDNPGILTVNKVIGLFGYELAIVEKVIELNPPIECPKCKKIKHSKDFYNDKASHNGLNRECVTCVSDYQKKRRSSES